MTLTWDIFTLFLYIGIIILTYFTSFFVLGRSRQSQGFTINVGPLFSLFFIFFIFSALRMVGTDYPTYQEIFQVSNNNLESSIFGIEPGFLFLNRLIRFFTDDSRYFFAIISFLTTLFIFLGILKFKGIMNIPFSILFYSTIFYFQSYSLIRAYLASAILLYGFYFLVTKRYTIFSIIFLITCTIHYSTLLLVPALVGLFLYKRGGLVFYLYLFIFFLIMYNSIDSLVIFNFTERYDNYIENIDKSARVGFAQFFLYTPVLWIIRRAKRNLSISTNLLLIAEVFVWFSLVYGIMGYWIPTIGRVNYLVTFPFIIFIPVYLNYIRFHKYYFWVYSFFIFYITVRLYDYFTTLAYADGINNYITIFN
jgi:transmembrane protein EpsG